MIQINELQFDNDDIGHLALHLGRTYSVGPAEAIPFTGTGAALEVYSGAGILVGYTAASSDGAAAHLLTVTDAVGAGGQPIIVDSLTANGGRAATFALGGVAIRRGLTVVTDATVTGVLYVLRRRHLG